MTPSSLSTPHGLRMDFVIPKSACGSSVIARYGRMDVNMTSKDPRRRAVLERSSGHAHADVYKSDKKCAQVLGISRMSANRYKRTGGPLNFFAKYLDNAPDQFRIRAHIESRMIHKRIKVLSKAELIALYHDTLQHECDLENHDRKLDVLIGASWEDKATASERDAATNLRKAAIEREFAARGITEKEVRE